MRRTSSTAVSTSPTARRTPCVSLRYHGFRPSNRYIVFQVLPDTLGLGPEVWKVLSMCHDARNRTEYEGILDVDDRVVSDLVSACREVASRVKQLPPFPASPL